MALIECLECGKEISDKAGLCPNCGASTTVGLEKYFELFINQARKNVEEARDNPEYQEIFENRLFGLNGPKQTNKAQTPSEKFFYQLFNGFSEIFDSYDCLLDIETYTGRFPYGGTRISKTRYLAYHMENHLHEIYILKERLTSYFTSIGRLYRGDSRHKGVLKITRPLFLLVSKSLKDITNIRSSHVHRNRFADDDLSRLKRQEIFVQVGTDDFKFIVDLYNKDYKITRKKFQNIMKENNNLIKKLIDGCFDVLYEIITDNKGQIKYPKQLPPL